MRKVTKKQVKGAVAVSIARDYLVSKGFETSLPRSPSASGHDLVGIKNGRGFTFEVKHVFVARGTWRVSRVLTKSSDLVAMVFPDGSVHLEPMKDYLKLCSKDAERSIALLGYVYA